MNNDLNIDVRVYPIEEPKGNTVALNEEISFTLNTIDKHAVAYGESSYGDYQEGRMWSTKTALRRRTETINERSRFGNRLFALCS
ncbi:hypothetical protein FACS1894202_11960 [Clostridia bacterium]|nr:hypothetical protein FACS1894202_11960 [Clostridia bacterium]